MAEQLSSADAFERWYGRPDPAPDDELRRAGEIATSISRLPLPSSPSEGWATVDSRVAALLASGRGRRWYEGWLGSGRARPLTQRLAAGVAAIGILGGGAGAAAGVSPIDAATAVGDAGSGIIRYVLRVDDDGTPSPSSGPEGVATTPPATTTTPEPQTPAPSATAPTAAQTPAPTTSAETPTETTYPAAQAGTVTIRHSANGLELLGVTPAIDWTYEVEHEESDRITVKFEYDDADDDDADDHDGVDDDDADHDTDGEDHSDADEPDDVRFEARLRNGVVVTNVESGE